MNGSHLLRLASNLGESDSRTHLLTLRLITLVIVVALLTVHLKSMRVFRWEHTASGGLLVTYTTAVLGLAICAGVNHCGSRALQAYLAATGAFFMTINAAVIWQRWTKAGDLTQVVAELLSSLGIRLKRQVITKVSLSIAAAVALLIDLIATPFLVPK